MKLYFYILDKPWKGEPKLNFSECEAEEKPKIYKIIERPRGFIGSQVRKEDIGHTIGYENDTVVLTEPNAELAKQALAKSLYTKLERAKGVVADFEAKLQAVNSFESEV